MSPKTLDRNAFLASMKKIGDLTNEIAEETEKIGTREEISELPTEDLEFMIDASCPSIVRIRVVKALMERLVAIGVAENSDEALAMINEEALYRGFYKVIFIEDLIEIDLSRKNTIIRQTWEKGNEE